MAPLVVIELEGSAPGSPYADEMARACTASLRKGECVLFPPDVAPTRSPSAFARVRVEGELRFEIRVTRSTSGGAEATSLRSLEFQLVDDEAERWRSVGIAIASTAAELDGPAEETPTSAGTREKPPPTSPRDGERPFRIAAGMVSGAGMESGRVRLGGWIDGAAQWGRRGPYVLAMGRYASAPGGTIALPDQAIEITSSWTTLGIGAGIAPIALSGVAFRLKVAGFAERFGAVAADASGRAVSSDDRWLPGWLGAVETVWPETGFLGALIGGDIESVTGATALELEGVPVGSSPAFKWGFFFGLELRP